MKQKLLATLLAFCLVVGMLPLAASAASTEVSVSTRSDFKAALENKDVSRIILTENIDFGAEVWYPVVVDRNLTIEGNNHVISNLKVTDYALQSDGSGIAGTGSSCDYYSGFIGWNKADLTINNLKFDNAKVDIDPLSDKSTGSSILAVVVANNTGKLVYNHVDVSNSVVKGYTKVGILHGFSQTGSFVANQCSITNSEVVLEADGTDKEAAFSGLIVGYDGNNLAKINGIQLYENCVSVDSSVNWGTTPIMTQDGVTSAGSWGLTCDTYTHGSNGTEKVFFVAEVNGYQYETLADAINAANGGDVITLLRDTSEARINIEKNIIIDLGTHTWTGTSEDCVFTVPGNHNVTIKNGSIVAPNLLGQVSGGNTIFEACSVTESDCLIVKGGTVLLKDTDITATAADAAGVRVNNGTFTLDADSSITAMGENHAVGVLVKGTDDSANPVVNIAGTIATYGSAVQGNGSDRSNPEINIQAGATLTAEKLAMYLPQPGTVNITGATVTGYAAIGIKSGTLNITDSVIHGKSNDDELGDEHSNTNGIAYDGSAIVIDSYIGYAGKMNLTISGESQIISDYSTAIHEIGNTAGATNVVSIQVNGGYFSSAANHKDILVRDVTKKTVTVSAGYFTSDPSQYLKEGKAAVESDKAGYNYMVADATKTPAEVVPAAPDASVNPDLTGKNKTAAEGIQNALPADVVAGDGVTAAANSVANQNTVTASDDVLKELNEAIGGNTATADNTTIVIQPYMEITIEDVDVQDQTVTLDITPMYRTVATTADLKKNEPIVLMETDESKPVNAVQIGKEKPLTITKPVTMALTLPDSFKGQKVYIQHKWYEYSATADNDGEITFTNPHGFSSFTFSTATQAAAKIDGTTYTSLQEAVNHVENGQTIILLKDGTATVDREVSFTIGNESSTTFKATLTPGSDYSMTEENGQYTFTKKPSTPVTPGPGDDDEDEFPFTDVKSGAWYYDAVKYVYENGLMAGTSDTTFDPEMKLNRAMAAQILYNLEGKPAVTEAATFTDAAAAGEWALDAIAWAQQTGVVAGMGDNLFAPDAQVTREQFAQMMYNYAKYKGYDLTATGDLTQFSDSSKLQSWAVTAMKWANGNGLINGFEDDTIQPAGTTIRGQAASIIMNFDKNVAE